ncbi:hypothetical protein BJ165DRAFT_1077529 [Panaeolus papilionaceus]|nr:hypothetical protein BJ165DRAFT_1077529 [Panaeolus papilionaceus]
MDKTGGDNKSKPVDPAPTDPVVFPIPKEPKKEPSPPPPYQMPTPVTEPPKVGPVTPSFPLPEPAPVPTPMPPSVPIVKKPTILSFPSLQSTPWVWTPEVQRTPRPRVGHTRAFRRTITTSTPINALTISIACDDLYTLYVNGKLVGCGKEWREPENYTVKFPPTVKVVVSVLGSQGPLQKDVGLSVSAIAYDAYSPYEAKTSTSFQTDSKWVCLVGDNFPPNFFEVDFNDSAWPAAFVQNSPWRYSMMGGITPGKAYGKRIIGEKRVPNAPDADLAELLKA